MVPNKVGLVIGAVFGVIYVVASAEALATPVGPLLQLLGLASFVGFLVALRHRRATPGDAEASLARFGRGYWFVAGAELASIIAGIAVLKGPLGLPQAVLPWISLVVGVHFFGLAKLWGQRSLWWLGAGISMCGALGLAVAAAGAAESIIATVAGVAPGALLLAGCWWTATRSPASIT